MGSQYETQEHSVAQEHRTVILQIHDWPRGLCAAVTAPRQDDNFLILGGG